MEDLKSKKTSLEGEVWRNVIGYEDLYEVSNMGRVYSHTTDMFLKPITDGKRGYEYVVLSDYFHRRKQYSIHRLVAIAFIPNPESKPEVDHIDRNRMNNNVLNLRWATRKENANNPLTLQNRSLICKGRHYHKIYTTEERQRMSEARRGRKQSQETIDKRAAKLRGKKMPEHVKAILREAKIKWTIQYREKKRLQEELSGVKKRTMNDRLIPILQMDLNGQIIKVWECARDVERELDISKANICACLKGRRITAGGYKWEYKTMP